MKKYIVTISPYPKEYEVEAESQEEARQIGKTRFSEETNGKSVWESEVVENYREDLECTECGHFENECEC